MKILDGPGDFFEVDKPYESVITFMRRSVPVNYRYYEDGWFLHRDYVCDAVKLGKCTGPVAYGDLPLDLQLEIAQDSSYYYNSKSAVKPKGDSVAMYYSTLFLTPNAPFFVVKAAYKALASRYHPDAVGGDAEKFKHITEAFEKVRDAQKGK